MGRRPLRHADAVNYLPNSYLVRRGLKPANPQTAVYLTDGAWNRFIRDATDLNYLKEGAYTAKGIVNYFTALATPSQVWVDARPDYLRDLSERLLDPSQDSERRIHTENTATYTFDPSLPRPTSPDKGEGPRHPIWWDPETDTSRRRRRTFVRATFPMDYYARLALTHHIGDPYHRYFQTTPTALASNALEAIGREMLTPQVRLPNQSPTKERHLRRNRGKEIAW